MTEKSFFRAMGGSALLTAMSFFLGWLRFPKETAGALWIQLLWIFLALFVTATASDVIADLARKTLEKRKLGITSACLPRALHLSLIFTGATFFLVGRISSPFTTLVNVAVTFVVFFTASLLISFFFERFIKAKGA